MKMLRVSLVAILSVVVSATNALPAEPATAAPTESPLDAAEHARQDAKHSANQTLQAVKATETRLLQKADDPQAIDDEVARIEDTYPNTTLHWSRERKRMMHENEHNMKREVHDEVDRAKSAADAYKHAARMLETQRRRAGLSESVYEGGFDQDENLAEGWHDEAENHGDAAENHIETFFDAVENKIEHHIDQQNHHDNQDDHDWGDWNQDWDEDEDEDQDEDEDEGENDQQGDQQDDHHDNQGEQQGDQPGNQHGDHRSTNVASAPLNLRAVGPTAANDSRGFFLTFACVGFLASLAFAVQMGRPTNRPASEPLLGA